MSDLIRALKAPSDPPVEGGPTKIEIAEETWAKEQSKGEVITEWILTKFLKETKHNSLLDLRYWNLVHDICSSSSKKTWLAPLLHRIPLCPVVIAFFTHQIPSLARSFTSCMSILWPIAVQRMNTEVLQDCFGSLLYPVSRHSELNKVGMMIVASYRNSLANSSSRKKLYQTFLQKHLDTWLQAISTSSDAKSSFLSAGIETLINLDTLRQTHDTKANLLIKQLQSISAPNFESDDDDNGRRTIILEFLPVLLSQYIQAFQKHRSALFTQSGQNTSLDQLRQSSTAFFFLVLSLVDANSRKQQENAWRARLALLGIMKKENVFSSGQRQGMDTVIDLILGVLGDAEEESKAIAMQCLSVMTRIDYDLVSPVLPRILTRLLEIPDSSEPYFEFLDLLLDFHTKTRSVHTLLEYLFDSIITSSSFHHDDTQAGYYQTTCSSSIVHDSFLEKLAKAINTFMTETQCFMTMKYVCDIVKSGSEAVLGGAKGKGNENPTAGDRMDVDVENSRTAKLAVRFTLQARLASVVLSSLPMQALSRLTLKQVREGLDGFRKESARGAVIKCLKVLKKKRKKGRGGYEEEDSAWPMEISLCALLRLGYAIEVSRTLGLPKEVDSKVQEKLTDLLMLENDTDLLPELTLEAFRTLLFNLSTTRSISSNSAIINALLSFLETHFVECHWSGQTYNLTKGNTGNARCAIAVMSMIVQRWMGVFDSLGTDTQIKRLLNILMGIKVSSPSLLSPLSPEDAEGKQIVSPRQVLLCTLHSAQFWEYRNIQTAFLDLLKERTSLVANDDNEKLASMSTLLETISTYQLLLLFPMEYFSFQVLSHLVKSALGVNSCLVRTIGVDDKDLVEGMIVLRVFVKRASGYLGGGSGDVGKEADLLLRVLEEPPWMMESDMKESYVNASLDLAEVYLLRLLKSSKRMGPDASLQVLQEVFNPSSSDFTRRTISSEFFVRFVDLLYRELPASSVHEGVLQAVRLLHKELSSQLFPIVTEISRTSLHDETPMRWYIHLVALWYSLLRLQKWLNVDEIYHKHQTQFVADKLIPVLLPGAGLRDNLHSISTELYIGTFAVLLEELEYRTEIERSTHLDVVLAVYVYLSGVVTEPELREMDIRLGKTSKKLPVADYAHLLTFVIESLSMVNLEDSSFASRLVSLVHLGSLLIHERPSHSLVHIQKFMAQCLGVFNDNSIYVNGNSKLRLQVLKMVGRYASDQQATLRAQELCLIWLILSKFLAPSQTHDPETQTSIFHKIVSILTSLIRLRSDLVTLCLPQLGLILRRLIQSIRGCRPNLGAKQMALVMNTQPSWISPIRPLGGEEAKALSRLLESLTVKTTTIRISSSSGPQRDAPKAESLSKPFSKHAAYVLKAYVEAMNDPLCVLSLDVRRELKEGLFALCGMMSVHSRDALMVGGGLDVGGKAVLKAIWKEWEGVRYVGKG